MLLVIKMALLQLRNKAIVENAFIINPLIHFLNSLSKFRLLLFSFDKTP